MGNSGEQIQMSCLSITELPTTVFFEILLKLSTKSIVMCKCVSKSWHSLISDPHFAEAHLAQAKTCTLIRDTHYLRFSRSLYLLEHEDVCSLDSGKNFQVKPKLKIPLTNVEAMLYEMDDYDISDDTDVMFCVATRSETEHPIISMNSSYSHKYDVVNSCNGLLCLRKKDRTAEIVICNPVLGEFIHVPVDYYANGGEIHFSHFALGFSPNQNRYKVIRISSQWRPNPEPDSNFSYVAVAEIHALGTDDSWRSVDISAFELSSLHLPVYLDGALYWIFVDRFQSYHMASFDLDEERFRVHSVPPLPRYRLVSPRFSIRAIGGRIYLYTDFAFTHVDIWVMVDNGISDKSWIKLFSIDVSELHGSRTHCTFQLLSCLNNEAVVMFGGPRDEFVYYDESEGLRCKQLEIEGHKSNFEAISCTPSFISLKDIVKQSDVEVLNINSGCGKLKLVEESYPLLLQGERN